MFYRFAVKTFFEDIKLNSGFNFLQFPDIGNKHYFYNINFSFEDKIYKRLAEFVYEDRENPFIFGMYNRGVLSPVPIQPRQFKAIGKNTGIGRADLYTVKNVQAQTNICWVSNDPTYLMEFEEYLLLSYDRARHYQADYEIPTDYLDIGNILSIDTTTKTIQIDRELNDLEIRDSLLISNSTLNDGVYVVSNFSVGVGYTDIVVHENINSSSIVGDIVKQNAVTVMPATIYLSDIESNQFENFNDQSRGELTFLVMSFNTQFPIVRKDSHGTTKLIKHINFKTKATIINTELTVNDMIDPYDEINIDAV